MRSSSLKGALAVAAALAISPPVRADSTVATIYPPDAGRASAEDVADVRALLQSALLRTQRSGGFVPAERMARAACGRAVAAEPACLARLAGGGVVLVAVVDRAATLLLVALKAVDGAGRVHGPVTVTIDAYLQNAEELARALVVLDERRRAAVAPPAQRDPPADLHPSAAASRPVATPRLADAPPRGATEGSWRRTAGPWTTVAGVVLLAAGGVTAELNRRLAHDLEARFRRGELGPADASRYRAVDRNNVLSGALLVAGGAVAATGLTLWMTAPDAPRRGAALGVSGRF